MGANSVGLPSTQRLLEASEAVVEVPTKPAAWERLFATGQGRTTDAHDAHSIARVTVPTTALHEAHR